jgi:uncharacterized membrane protein
VTPIDRLTAVLADSRRYDDPFVKPSTDDLALVLAVVEAAKEYMAGLDNELVTSRQFMNIDATFRTALAAIEGSTK